MERIEHARRRWPRIVDLSADFRLRDAAATSAGTASRTAPGVARKFVYGLPELHRDEIAGAHSYVSGVGCNATATNLAVCRSPAAGLIDTAARRDLRGEGRQQRGRRRVERFDAPSRARRRGAQLRADRPPPHRRGAPGAGGWRTSTTDVHLSATAVDNVRGVLATAHVFVKPGAAERDLWQAYREAYSDEPFVRIVKERTGIYR